MKFILNKDNLNIEDSQLLNSGSTGYYEIDVECDEQWQGLMIAVVMTKKGESVGSSVAVINNKVCIDRAVNGSYLLGVIGYKIENEQKVYQISTNLKSVYFNKGAGEIETKEQEVPTPTEWEIYLSQIQTIFNNIKELTEGLNEKVLDIETKLVNGEFNGKDGIDGKDGANGQDGENGATFTPNVDSEGNLSWSNDKGLENPPSINIKGKDGEAGATFKVTTTLPEVNTEGYSVLEPNTKYYLGTTEELSIVFPNGELGDLIDIQFLSDGTPTVLNINNENTSNLTEIIEIGYIYTLNGEYSVIGYGEDSSLLYGWKLTIDKKAIKDKRKGYTELEYIEGTGTQYINTNFIPKTGMTDYTNAYFDAEFEFTTLDGEANVFRCL